MFCFALTCEYGHSHYFFVVCVVCACVDWKWSKKTVNSSGSGYLFVRYGDEAKMMDLMLVVVILMQSRPILNHLTSCLTEEIHGLPEGAGASREFLKSVFRFR